MDVFTFRDTLIENYASYVQSFIQIRDARINDLVTRSLASGQLWPEPLVQLNPAFAPGASIDDLVAEGILHPECAKIFRIKSGTDGLAQGRELRLHRHQDEAIRSARAGHNYVLTTGTGSGKSLSYIVPIVDRVLRQGSGKGITALIVYPMNALANSQYGELEKFLTRGYPAGGELVRFRRYTGQESDDDKAAIIADPPDILLTNYVMLELILTRPQEANLISAAQGLQFLVLDELHTYRGRQGADVALLMRRVRDRLAGTAQPLQYVGTSATLAGRGTLDQQRAQVATVATRLFGAPVSPEHVISETLRRATTGFDADDPTLIAALTERVADRTRQAPLTLAAFLADPLNRWIESTFGIQEAENGTRLVRATPQRIATAAHTLQGFTAIDEERCAEVLRQSLLASYSCERDPVTERPPFAFRLHQFISRGDAVYASLEAEAQRHLTLQGQQFVPNGERSRILLPLVFCRECGQEYYCVYMHTADPERRHVVPRELSDKDIDAHWRAGFLYYSGDNPWPTDLEGVLRRVPDDWIEVVRGEERLRRDRRDRLPVEVCLTPDGREEPDELPFSFVPAPFRFCLHCGVSYGARQDSDFGKLASLSSEGRSTATTITSLFAIRDLRRDTTLPPRARKLLSFTDNRQDAALQAGHFNDFVEIGQLRGALYKAVARAGSAGIKHAALSQEVFEALTLDPVVFTGKTNLRRSAIEDAEEALRLVLGYRLYHDLRRGWRVTAPNLEQCGLLRITYPDLEEVCADERLWAETHPALAGAAPATRAGVARALLDHMRRELAIKVAYLERTKLEQIALESKQHLAEPWAIDENERMEQSTILFPTTSRDDDDYRNAIYLSPRSAFGQYLRRHSTFPQCSESLRLTDTAAIIRDLLTSLEGDRLVEVVVPARNGSIPGYQLSASAMRWVVGDGAMRYHDPIRTPSDAQSGGLTNRFFVNFYRTIASDLGGITAREHTAQVPYEERLQRESDFYDARLAVLYCSPTMELGVDISDLNVVNMRNMPPTPANYAQRSGRAGRNNQPALVFTYCATGNSHDQYFFKRPSDMVSGAVIPPRIDLANEDLVRAHIYAIWLAETGLDLRRSLKELLDIAGEEPALTLLPQVRRALSAPEARARAARRARQVLGRIDAELSDATWFSDNWLDEVLEGAADAFDAACERWRSLYRAALKQAKAQDRVIRDASRSQEDKRQAETLRREAEAQLALLTESNSVLQSDFYSYRYIASEGFLPGYSFPRLPLAAYIPGRRGHQGHEKFLSRPRFLAISEFGPRAIVYHEGSRYLINKVILPVRESGELPTQRVKQCAACGYLHPLSDGKGPDKCQHCFATLAPELTALLRMQNVATRRRDRISSDEEERFRVGYDIRTGVRFEERQGQVVARRAVVMVGSQTLGDLTYGHATTIWRINLGWKRRKEKNLYGFVLDVERGYWASDKANVSDEGEAPDPLSPRTQRVIPFVEDRRNCLLFQPHHALSGAEMASLQAALKSAIQIEYQLEDNELASEPLPDYNDRRTILLYESAEGGAGVLRRLIDDPQALARVARQALDLCHYDPESGDDRRRARDAREDCEAACYDCLMTYGNQGDHQLLDRAAIKDHLWQISRATVDEIAPPLPLVAPPIEEGLAADWLRYLEHQGYTVPSDGRHTVGAATPDFVYRQGGAQVAIYIDGPRDGATEAVRDSEAVDELEDDGYVVLRFGDPSSWEETLARHPDLFGRPTAHATLAQDRASVPAPIPVVDLADFDDEWHPLLHALAAHPPLVIEPGGEVVQDGRVQEGGYLATVHRDNRALYLIDARLSSAERISLLQQAEGKKTHLIDPDDPVTTAAQVIAALGEG